MYSDKKKTKLQLKISLENTDNVRQNGKNLCVCTIDFVLNFQLIMFEFLC